MKFPLLIEHFVEHRAENPQISVGDFLDMHYFTGHEKDADYDKDMQLPFKSFETSQTFVQMIFPKNWDLNKPLFYGEVYHNFLYSENVSISHINSIFRPPQIIFFMIFILYIAV